MRVKEKYYNIFQEHLTQAETSKKPLQSRLLHAELAQIYYDLWKNAPMEEWA